MIYGVKIYNIQIGMILLWVFATYEMLGLHDLNCHISCIVFPFSDRVSTGLRSSSTLYKVNAEVGNDCSRTKFEAIVAACLHIKIHRFDYLFYNILSLASSCRSRGILWMVVGLCLLSMYTELFCDFVW